VCFRCCSFSPTAAGEGPLLADYKEHHTDVSVHFDVDLVPGKLAALSAAAGGLETKFKLSSKISTGAGCASKHECM
jgi:DNA topoisomerase-2